MEKMIAHFDHHEALENKKRKVHNATGHRAAANIAWPTNDSF
jgi:hypothetical protein